MEALGENPAEAFSDLEGDVRATYKGARDVDGVSCGVIELDFKVHSNKDLTEKARNSKDGREAGQDVKFDHVTAFLSFEGSGELTWDLAAGYARSFTMSAKIKNQMEVAFKVATGDKSMDIQRKMQISGTYELKVAVAAR